MVRKYEEVPCLDTEVHPHHRWIMRMKGDGYSDITKKVHCPGKMKTVPRTMYDRPKPYIHNLLTAKCQLHAPHLGHIWNVTKIDVDGKYAPQWVEVYCEGTGTEVYARESLRNCQNVQVHNEHDWFDTSDVRNSISEPDAEFVKGHTYSCIGRYRTDEVYEIRRCSGTVTHASHTWTDDIVGMHVLTDEELIRYNRGFTYMCIGNINNDNLAVNASRDFYNSLSGAHQKVVRHMLKEAYSDGAKGVKRLIDDL